MNRRVTMKDIAEACGVSVATVSRVLNGNPRVAPELVERVEREMRDQQYRPNGVGRALRKQRGDLWAAIVPDVRNPFFHRLLESFEKVAHQHGYAVMLCNTHEDLALERSAIDAVISHQAAGVLVAAVSATKTSLHPLQLQGIPVVSVDRLVTDFSGDRINVDNPVIGTMVAEHFLEQGWHSPVVVAHEGRLSPLNERVRGFVDAMHERGIDVPPSRVLHLPFESASTPEQLVSAMADPSIDSVFAVTNTLSAESYRALRGAGRKIGTDVALVGVDDDRWNVMVDPPVTVVDQPAEHLGQWAGEVLQGRITGNAAGNARMLLEPEWRIRASSMRAS